MTRPVKVNLKRPETWPKGWELFAPDCPMVVPYGTGRRVAVWFGEWTPCGRLLAGEIWIPMSAMPPAPTSRKWRTK